MFIVKVWNSHTEMHIVIYVYANRQCCDMAYTYSESWKLFIFYVWKKYKRLKMVLGHFDTVWTTLFYPLVEVSHIPLLNCFSSKCFYKHHMCKQWKLFLMSVWPCIVDDMKRLKPTRLYTMVYWTLWIALHVSGITMPIVRSSRLYRWSQRMAPHCKDGIVV